MVRADLRESISKKITFLRTLSAPLFKDSPGTNNAWCGLFSQSGRACKINLGHLKTVTNMRWGIKMLLHPVEMENTRGTNYALYRLVSQSVRQGGQNNSWPLGAVGMRSTLSRRRASEGRGCARKTSLQCMIVDQFGLAKERISMEQKTV